MLDALQAEWGTCPPVHRLVAAYLDYKSPSAQEADTDKAMLDLQGAMTVDPNAPKLDDSAWRAAQGDPNG